jgi:hypothetical protein
MKDLEIHLENKAGSLAKMGEVLSEAGISIEGGGAWVVNNKGIAHFLFEDAEKARKILEKKGIEVIKENKILLQRLRQDQPGQLGKIARLMEQAGVNIEVIYSDHNNQLVLVVDNYEKGLVVSNNWTKGLYT